MKTTNIYFLIDCSNGMRGNRMQNLHRNVIQSKRRLDLFDAYADEADIKLHTIGFNKRGFILNPYDEFPAEDYSDYDEGYKMLLSVMQYEHKYGRRRTRSVFLFHTLGESVDGWEDALEDLYDELEFATGLRYAVCYSGLDRKSRSLLRSFTDGDDRVLNHFSENRLCSLVKSILGRPFRR